MRRVIAILALVSIVAASSTALGYTPGVPTGLTGAPSEETCANCHDNLNTGSGWLTITAPNQYLPGETIDVFVQVGHDGQEKWGFEVTALDGANEPIGSLVVTDALRTQYDSDGGTGREYVMHTEEGTDTGVLDVSPGWSFQWTAPAGARQSVTFYACAVAANDAQGTNGDWVYTQSLTLSETGIEDEITWSRIKWLYR